MLSAVPAPPPFSPVIVLALVAVLSASGVVLRILIRRATTGAEWVALSDWAAQNRFKLSSDQRPARLRPDLPPPLAKLTTPPPRPGTMLVGAATTLVQLHTAGPVPAPAAGAPAVGQRVKWHLLLRRVEADWSPTGLRPQGNGSSLLDLFPLTSFPTLASPERFVVFGTEPAAARALARSSLDALLPPDVGLLVHGHYLILDFSTRPFDALELSRMCGLAEQLVANLPGREG